MRTNTTRRCQLSLQSLEGREVPAGAVTTAVSHGNLVITGDTAGTLQGICPDCDRMIYRRANPQKIGTVLGDLEVTFTKAGSRIEDTTEPNVNCDFIEGGDHD